MKTALRRRILSKYDTLGEFASEMGVSKQTMTNWVTGGRIPMKRIVQMSEKLGVGKDEIGEVFFGNEAL